MADEEFPLEQVSDAARTLVNGEGVTSPLMNWEDVLSPERAALKETADLLSAVLQTVALTEQPQKTIAGYAEGFLSKHEAELPLAVVQEINDKRVGLLRQPGPEQ